ncbi:hypothetical protein [Singulisphaera sp. PoT]|uniref:hypothetical protein n=1 Tax=Singulisphaera sp. PoT TaxID=3411797 RepID=UPI003BF5420F
MSISLTRCSLVFALSACFLGCNEDAPQQPTQINPTATVAAPASSPSNGIPSSGGALKRKPDPVGAMSPIIPPK